MKSEVLQGRRSGNGVRSTNEKTRKDWISLSESRLRNIAIHNGPEREAAWRELDRRFGPKLSHSIKGKLIRLGTSASVDVVEDLVQSTWLRATQGNHRILRAWKPSRGSLGPYLVQIGIWETLTSRRLWAMRKQVKLDEIELRWLADRPVRNVSRERAERLNNAEPEIRAWEARLGLFERKVWEFRKGGASSRVIGLLLGRDHKTVCTILKRIQHGVRQILVDSES